MDAYLLFISLGSGVISVAIVLIEIGVVRRFILSNQDIEKVPKTTDRDTDKIINKHIKEFRKFVLSKQGKEFEALTSIRKKLLIFRNLMIAFSALMFALLFISYMMSSN